MQAKPRVRRTSQGEWPQPCPSYVGTRDHDYWRQQPDTGSDANAATVRYSERDEELTVPESLRRVQGYVLHIIPLLRRLT